MALSRKDEQRLLSADERALVDKTRGAALAALADTELSNLLKLLRERQSRARTIASRQAREMRGKADPSSKAAAARNDGSANARC